MAEYITKEQALMQLTGRFPKDMSLEKYISLVTFRINELSAEDVIPIPKGATNGDIITTTFPDAQIDYHEKSDLADSHITVFPKDCDTCQDYSYDYWNAKYKKETEE